MTAELNLASAKSMYEQAANRQRLAIEDLRLVTGLPANAELLLPALGVPGRTVAVPAVAESEQRAFATPQGPQGQ